MEWMVGELGYFKEWPKKQFEKLFCFMFFLKKKFPSYSFSTIASVLMDQRNKSKWNINDSNFWDETSFTSTKLSSLTPELSQELSISGMI